MQPTVLVVEDSASVRRLIEVCLRPLAVNIVPAEDGRVGIHAAFAAPPDAVVLDIGLPHIDGWEVLRRLRENPDTAAVPVLVLTAHAQPEVQAQAEQGGANAFMTKPFGPEDLRLTVKRMLDGDI